MDQDALSQGLRLIESHIFVFLSLLSPAIDSWFDSQQELLVVHRVESLFLGRRLQLFVGEERVRLETQFHKRVAQSCNKHHTTVHSIILMQSLLTQEILVTFTCNKLKCVHLCRIGRCMDDIMMP